MNLLSHSSGHLGDESPSILFSGLHQSLFTTFPSFQWPLYMHRVSDDGRCATFAPLSNWSSDSWSIADVMDEQGECGVIGMMMAFGNDRSGLGVFCRLRQPTRATAPQRPPLHSRLHSEASDCWQWVKHY